MLMLILMPVILLLLGVRLTETGQTAAAFKQGMNGSCA
jgi:hypothetical protein